MFFECVLSTLPDKRAALGTLAAELETDGVIAFTNVTVDGNLPEPLTGILASAPCVGGGALPLAGYRSLMEAAGLECRIVRDVSDAASGFLAALRSRLMLAEPRRGRVEHRRAGRRVAASARGRLCC